MRGDILIADGTQYHCGLEDPRGMFRPQNSLHSPLSWLTVGLLFSVGWGIRGNFGHETGAMFPGILGAVAVCLFSQRDDWQRRVPFFALFGMLGWAFGGSISYMMLIGYTHSGHSATQAYGFAMLFVVGFLWAALGGAATAVPATFAEADLRELLRPLTVVLVLWSLMYVCLEPGVNWAERWIDPLTDAAMGGATRQERPLYWLDSDWIQVGLVLITLLIFQLVEQRFRQGWWLLVSMAVGGLLTYVVFGVMAHTTSNVWIERALVQYQGVVADGYPTDRLAVMNWPRWFLLLGHRPGLWYSGETLALWGGAILGVIFFFVRWGEFQFGTRLLTLMGVGWYASFLALPVLGSLACAEVGGLRMTPPRGDNWAGILGTLVAGLVVCWRAGHRALIVVSIVCGTLGGLAFSGAAWSELMLVAPGNPTRQVPAERWVAWQAEPAPALEADGTRPAPVRPDVLSDYPFAPGWQHYHQQNWHSYLEQSYGFLNGLALCCAMAFLVPRTPTRDWTHVSGKWWENLAILFAGPAVIYVNMIKNVDEWTSRAREAGGLAEQLKAPWIDWTLTTRQWFQFFFALAVVAVLVLLSQRGRKTLAFVPPSWLGRGQWLLLLILWIFIAGNLIHALPGFSEGRLLTEGITYIHAVIASVLLLIFATTVDKPRPTEFAPMGRALLASVLLLVVVVSASTYGEWLSVRHVYGDAPSGKRGIDYRWGSHANWHRTPLLRGARHR